MPVIATWNIKEGNSAKHVSKVVRRMHEVIPFDILFLHEAKGVYRELELPGFHIYQLPSENPPWDIRPENSNTCVIYPKHAPKTKVYPFKMKLRWRGPKLGILHAPRMFLWMKPTWLTQKTWKIGGGHFPFNKAQDEAFRKVKWWFFKTVPGRPTVFAADFNATSVEIRKKLRVKYARAWGPDGFAYRNCRLIKTRVYTRDVLDMEDNSDHPPVVGFFK